MQSLKSGLGTAFLFLSLSLSLKYNLLIAFPFSVKGDKNKWRQEKTVMTSFCFLSSQPILQNINIPLNSLPLPEKLNKVGRSKVVAGQKRRSKVTQKEGKLEET
jgi:hypothetical protein